MKKSVGDAVTTANQDVSRDATKSGAAPTPRKPYARPVLESLGDIRDLTMGGSAGVGESGGRKTKTGRG